MVLHGPKKRDGQGEKSMRSERWIVKGLARRLFYGAAWSGDEGRMVEAIWRL
jgi:hypothetical protein